MNINKKYIILALVIGTIFLNVKIFAAIAWTTTGTSTWSDGPVGIGTSSLSGPSKLQVNGMVSATDYKSTASVGKFALNQSDIFYAGVGGNVYSRGFSTNAMGIFNGSTSFQDIYLYNKNGADAGYLVLKASNQVGINTNNPGGALGIDTPVTTNWMSLRNPSDGSIYRFNNAGSQFEIGTYDGTNGQTHWNVFKIVRNGDIVMGNNADPVNLSVNGGIKTKQILVSNTGWADYVFADDYKLTPLSEVDQYIKENKHLPNIPSAEEIDENGLSLGEMQKKQMEKIEELTLYLIQLEEKVHKLENENTERKSNLIY